MFSLAAYGKSEMSRNACNDLSLGGLWYLRPYLVEGWGDNAYDHLSPRSVGYLRS